MPFAETSSAEHELSFFSRPSTGVHNPYPCFGGAGVVWPRGFPPAKIRDKSSSMCGVVMGGGGAGEQRVGVVQALADNNPDVDGLYRMTCAPGGSPLSFVEESPRLPGSSLRLVPAWTFSPYNAKVTPATLGASVVQGIKAAVFLGFTLWRAWADYGDRADQRQQHSPFGWHEGRDQRSCRGRLGCCRCLVSCDKSSTCRQKPGRKTDTAAVQLGMHDRTLNTRPENSLTDGSCNPLARAPHQIGDPPLPGCVLGNAAAGDRAREGQRHLAQLFHTNAAPVCRCSGRLCPSLGYAGKGLVCSTRSRKKVNPRRGRL